jgi:hypothetical protein
MTPIARGVFELVKRRVAFGLDHGGAGAVLLGVDDPPATPFFTGTMADVDSAWA